MSWGLNNQSVTANSTTTAETSNGAPMGLWNYVHGQNVGANLVSHSTNAHFGNTSPGSRASEDVALFQNTTVGSFGSKKVVGVFGVTANQMTYQTTNHLADQPAHSGWVMRRAGTGPIVKVGYTGTASGYSNTDYVTFVSPGGANAVATMVTNSTGGSLVLTLTVPGDSFVTVNNAGVYTNSTGGTGAGTGATFYATAGGRAGRVHTETIVAMGTILPGVNNSIYTANT